MQLPKGGAARDALLESLEADAVQAELARQSESRGLIDFLYLLVSICQRICVAISVQLLAASVRAQQPSRLVRTVSLIGLATFFVFVESLTHQKFVIANQTTHTRKTQVPTPLSHTASLRTTTSRASAAPRLKTAGCAASPDGTAPALPLALGASIARANAPRTGGGRRC